MKQITPQKNWPELWKQSYKFDCQEFYGQIENKGYYFHYRNRFDIAVELINKYIKPQSSILDVAAAQGNFSLRLAEMGYEVTWNDIRADLIDYVKLKYESGSLNFRPGNIIDLSPEPQYDAVLISEIIEHTAHPDVFLSKVLEFLKPGGILVLTTPNGQYFRFHRPKFSECKDPSQYEQYQFQPDTDGHIFLFHLDELTQIINKFNLSILDYQLYTNFFSNGHCKTEFILRITPERIVKYFEFVSRKLPLSVKKKLFTGMAIAVQKKI